MEALLCEPEDRLGSQASASVTRPNSMIMQARRSAFYPTVGSSGSVDGAEHIKVRVVPHARRRDRDFLTLSLPLSRRIRGSEGSTGIIFASTLHRSGPNSATPRTRATLTQTSHRRCVWLCVGRSPPPLFCLG